MVVERGVLFRIQHFQQSRGRIAAIVGTQLVDLVQQEKRIGGIHLLHRLDDPPRHGTDIGPAVAANLGLVPYAAQRHAHKIASGRLGDRPAQRGLAHTRRPDEAEDRPLQLLGPRLHGQMLQDPFLDLLQTVMVVIEHRFGAREIILETLALAPRYRENPVEIITYDRGLGRHRAHIAQLLELRIGLGARLFGKLGLGQLFLKLGQLLAAVIALAQLALDRLHLLVEIILTLGLLHLALDARADLLLDLQNADLAFHQTQHALQPAGHIGLLQQGLLFLDLDRQMGRNAVGQLGGLADLRQRRQRFRRHLLVQFDIVFELGRHGTHQRFQLGLVAGIIRERLADRLIIVLARRITGDLDTAAALDQHLDRAVGQFEQLQDRRHHTHGVDCIVRRLVIGGRLLRGQQNLLVGLHHLFQRADGFVASDKERHDHVGKDHNVAQRQKRKCLRIGHAYSLRTRQRGRVQITSDRDTKRNGRRA